MNDFGGRYAHIKYVVHGEGGPVVAEEAAPARKTTTISLATPILLLEDVAYLYRTFDEEWKRGNAQRLRRATRAIQLPKVPDRAQILVPAMKRQLQDGCRERYAGRPEEGRHHPCSGARLNRERPFPAYIDATPKDKICMGFFFGTATLRQLTAYQAV